MRTALTEILAVEGLSAYFPGQRTSSATVFDPGNLRAAMRTTNQIEASAVLDLGYAIGVRYWAWKETSSLCSNATIKAVFVAAHIGLAGPVGEYQG